MTMTKESLTCQHGQPLTSICPYCTAQYEEDRIVLEDIRARFRFTDQL